MLDHYPGRTAYICKSVAVPIGAVNQEVDVATLLATAGRATGVQWAHWFFLSTDVDVTVRLNDSSADEISLTSANGLLNDAQGQPPYGAVRLMKLYLSHTGASSGSGDATVNLFAI